MKSKRDPRRIPKHFRIASRSNPGVGITSWPMKRDKETGSMKQDDRFLVASTREVENETENRSKP